MFTNDITALVARHFETEAVKKIVARYKQIAGAKINFDKSEGLHLGVWSSGVSLSELFCWSDRPIHILEVWFELGLLL